MIPPALLVLRVGRVWLPLPIFLLWPLVLIAWIVVGALWLLWGLPRRGRLRMMLNLLAALNALRGLSVDVRGDDENVNLRFI